MSKSVKMKMRAMNKYGLLLVAGLVVAACGPGQDDEDLDLGNVPEDYGTIAPAIQAVADGGRVVVEPGTYGPVDFGGREIVVESSNPTDPGVVAATIIEGSDGGCVVMFESGETRATVLRGFKVTGGAGARANLREGGGICVRGTAAPTIEGNLITGNTAQRGGGISVTGGSPLITGNTIEENTGEDRGSGIFVGEGASAEIVNNLVRDNIGGSGAINVSDEGTTAQIIDNEITGNTTEFGVGGVAVYYSSFARVEGNEIRENEGRGDRSSGGITVLRARAEIVENVIVDNLKTGGVGGAGITVAGHSSEDASAEILDNEIRANINEPSHGGGIHVAMHGVARIEDNLIADNVAGGSGGGIAVIDPRQDQEGNDNITVIVNNEIRGNSLTALDSGGGIAVRIAIVEIVDNHIHDNAASMETVSGTRNGGGISLAGSSEATIHGNQIENNQTGSRGGGIYVDRDTVVRDAAGNDWPRLNSPPESEPNNTYSGNTHSDTCGQDVFFRDTSCD